jgi:hypothetical protein
LFFNKLDTVGGRLSQLTWLRWSLVAQYLFFPLVSPGGSWLMPPELGGRWMTPDFDGGGFGLLPVGTHLPKVSQVLAAYSHFAKHQY